LSHHDLAIVDPSSGKQPLFSEDKQLDFSCMGEIYNHRKLRKQFEGNITSNK
jgi:asparagine synthase (glutamine-hydrolysing)